MAKLTRRGFFKQTSAGVATIGVLSTLPTLAVVSESEAPAVTSAAETELSATALSEPMVAHVRDLSTGEISLLVGTREIFFRDPELVVRLLRAAR